MANPILQQLTGSRANMSLGNIGKLKDLLNGKNPNAVYQELIYANPKFREFVSANQGKSPEQIASAYGIDLNQVRNLLK